MVSAPAASTPMADFEAAFLAEAGRRPRTELRQAMSEILPWLGRCARHDGPRILRSVPQMVRGIGWPSTGSAKRDHQRYRNNIANRLEQLVRIGWVERWEAVYSPNGEGVGILIVLTPAGVAQSVGATSRRPLCETRHRGRVSRIPVVAPPCGNASVGRSSQCSPRGKASVRARTHERRTDDGGRRRTLHIERLRQTCRRDGNGRCLRPAARSGADPVAVAVVAWERMHDGRHPQLTRRRREHLERACRVLDRLTGRVGYGVEQLLTLMDARYGWSRRGETALPCSDVASLDFYVCQLRQIARALRRKHRGRPALELRDDWTQPWWAGRPVAVPPAPKPSAPDRGAPEGLDETPVEIPDDAPRLVRLAFAPPKRSRRPDAPAGRRAAPPPSCECGVLPHRAWCPGC
jgi:hypothetical protein